MTAQLKTALEHIDELDALQQSPLTNLVQVRDEQDRAIALRVADKLALPRTTFYRRLQRGLTRIAQQLRAGEFARS